MRSKDNSNQIIKLSLHYVQNEFLKSPFSILVQLLAAKPRIAALTLKSKNLYQFVKYKVPPEECDPKPAVIHCGSRKRIGGKKDQVLLLILKMKFHIYEAVSYTHLTLPTIYSV